MQPEIIAVKMLVSWLLLGWLHFFIKKRVSQDGWPHLVIITVFIGLMVSMALWQPYFADDKLNTAQENHYSEAVPEQVTGYAQPAVQSYQSDVSNANVQNYGRSGYDAEPRSEGSSLMQEVRAFFTEKYANYDDCIMKNMKGVMSNQAANSIRTSCRQTILRQNRERSYPLPSAELGGVSGYGDYGWCAREGCAARYEYFHLTIKNNTRFTLTEATIVVEGEIYYVDIEVEPFRQGSHMVQLVKPLPMNRQFEWALSGVMGF